MMTRLTTTQLDNPIRQELTLIDDCDFPLNNKLSFIQYTSIANLRELSTDLYSEIKNMIIHARIVCNLIRNNTDRSKGDRNILSKAGAGEVVNDLFSITSSHKEISGKLKRKGYHGANRAPIFCALELSVAAPYTPLPVGINQTIADYSGYYQDMERVAGHLCNKHVVESFEHPNHTNTNTHSYKNKANLSYWEAILIRQESEKVFYFEGAKSPTSQQRLRGASQVPHAQLKEKLNQEVTHHATVGWPQRNGVRSDYICASRASVSRFEPVVIGTFLPSLTQRTSRSPLRGGGAMRNKRRKTFLTASVQPMEEVWSWLADEKYDQGIDNDLIHIASGHAGFNTPPGSLKEESTDLDEMLLQLEDLISVDDSSGDDSDDNGDDSTNIKIRPLSEMVFDRCNSAVDAHQDTPTDQATGILQEIGRLVRAWRLQSGGYRTVLAEELGMDPDGLLCLEMEIAAPEDITEPQLQGLTSMLAGSKQSKAFQEAVRRYLAVVAPPNKHMK